MELSNTFANTTVNRRWAVVALIFFGIVVSYVDRGNLSIAAPSIMRDFTIAPATMGVLLSAFFWTYALFQIPAGALVDRFGIRRSYAVGFLIWSIASASVALSRRTGDIVGLRMVLGLAESIGPLASLSFIRNNFSGKDQGLPTSIYIAGQNVGPALGALLGAFLLDRFGWRLMFALTGVGALIWLPFWLFTAPADGTRATRQAERAADDLAAPRRWSWRLLLQDRVFWAMSLAILLHSYYWYFFLTWIPSYLVISRGFSTIQMGKVVSAALFAMAATNIAGGFVADRIAARRGVFRTRLLFAATGCFGMAAMLLLAVAPVAWVLPILIFSMCATGIGSSNFWTISQHVPPKNMVGRTIGFLNSVSQLAGAIAPIVTGWLLGPEKHFAVAIVVAGVCPVLAAICLLVAGSNGLQRMKSMLAGDTVAAAATLLS